MINNEPKIKIGLEQFIKRKATLLEYKIITLYEAHGGPRYMMYKEIK